MVYIYNYSMFGKTERYYLILYWQVDIYNILYETQTAVPNNILENQNEIIIIIIITTVDKSNIASGFSLSGSVVG